MVLHGVRTFTGVFISNEELIHGMCTEDMHQLEQVVRSECPRRHRESPMVKSGVSPCLRFKQGIGDRFLYGYQPSRPIGGDSRRPGVRIPAGPLFFLSSIKQNYTRYEVDFMAMMF